jgi:hypothetical protein
MSKALFEFNRSLPGLTRQSIIYGKMDARVTARIRASRFGPRMTSYL